MRQYRHILNGLSYSNKTEYRNYSYNNSTEYRNYSYSNETEYTNYSYNSTGRTTKSLRRKVRSAE